MPLSSLRFSSSRNGVAEALLARAVVPALGRASKKRHGKGSEILVCACRVCTKMNQVRNTGRKARRHQILPGCMRLYIRVLALMDLRADVVVAMPRLIEYVPEEKRPKHGGSSELKPESKGASRRYRSHRE